jgi:hypothetical protein
VSTLAKPSLAPMSYKDAPTTFPPPDFQPELRQPLCVSFPMYNPSRAGPVTGMACVGVSE